MTYFYKYFAFRREKALVESGLKVYTDPCEIGPLWWWFEQEYCNEDMSKGAEVIFLLQLRDLIIYDLAWLSKAINRYNVDND
jgi:hypothetical protein